LECVFDKPRGKVQKLTDHNIKTYVVSLAGDDQMLMQNLAGVAKTGATGQAPFVPQTAADLRSSCKASAFRIRGASCSW
jgi:hypothetical protein